MNILGISGMFHDAAAALVQDGVVVAAAQEERFTRRKHDPSLPQHAIAYCLEAGGISGTGLDHVVFYEKPISAFARLLKTQLQVAPRGFGQFRRAMPSWFGDKLWVDHAVGQLLRSFGVEMPGPLLYTEHHQAHAASAFFPSPFPSAAVLTMDGVGEWATASIGHGIGNAIEPVRQLDFPHSLGLLYSAFTYHCGFRVNSGEYKLMGLAPYGEPTYRDVILDTLIDLRDDGSFHVNTKAMGYLSGLRMTNKRFEQHFGGPARRPGDPLTRREADLARSIQEVTEEVVLRMARTAAELTNEDSLCLAGGVALNAVANGRLLREGPFADIWVQPAAGDAGSAIGAALHVWHEMLDMPRAADGSRDAMGGCQLGPAFDAAQIAAALERHGLVAEELTDEQWAPRLAALLASGNVIGLFDGRMEFGPRALGHRSILADPRSPDAQRRVNLQVKGREGFRPFAPAVLWEHAQDWFDLDRPLPYMTFVVPVAPTQRISPSDETLWPPEARVAGVRSTIPAVTHVDHSARVQTVTSERSPRFHRLLSAFEAVTGCPVLLNTSLNVRGEPIACTPDDAIALFLRGDVDHLVLGNHLLCQAPSSDAPTASE